MKREIWKRLIIGLLMCALACAPVALQPQPGEYVVLRSALPRAIRDLLVEADSYKMTTILFPKTDLLDFDLSTIVIECLNADGDTIRKISGDSDPIIIDYTYDEAGNKIYEKNVSSYSITEVFTEYDALDRPVLELAVSYDEERNERRRYETVYTYDPSGIGTAVVRQDGIEKEWNELDADGRIVAKRMDAFNMIMTARYVYDEYGAMVRSEVENNGELRINENRPVYDAAGNVISNESWQDGELQGTSENHYVDGVLRETVETDTAGNVYRTIYQDIIG